MVRESFALFICTVNESKGTIQTIYVHRKTNDEKKGKWEVFSVLVFEAMVKFHYSLLLIC